MNKRLPTNTIAAPTPSAVFPPLPNHHTLRQRLRAFLVVNTRFVDTEDTCCLKLVSIICSFTIYRHTEDSRLTPDTQTSWDTKLPPKIRNDLRVDEVEVPSLLERLQKPCLMSDIRKRNIGRERKCFKIRMSDVKSFDTYNHPHRIKYAFLPTWAIFLVCPFL